MLKDTEPSATFWDAVQDAIFQIFQIIDVRLALLLGLAVFMLAVGFDSSGNKAEAADLLTQASLVPVQVSTQSGVEFNGYASEAPVLTSHAQMAAARRLRHGNLAGAIITNNWLTDAHFFTDLPVEGQ